MPPKSCGKGSKRTPSAGRRSATGTLSALSTSVDLHKTPAKGRTVSRMENEELLDALRERMHTPEAQKLYKQRSRTVELNFADLKEHRGLRRFHCRGLRRVTAEVGSLVLTHNLLCVEAAAGQQNPSGERLPQALCPT